MAATIGSHSLLPTEFEATIRTRENGPCARAFRSRCQQHRKRGSQHHVNGCGTQHDARATTLFYKSGEFPKPIAVLPTRDPDHSCHQRHERRQNTVSLPELHVSAASDVESWK